MLDLLKRLAGEKVCITLRSGESRTGALVSNPANDIIVKTVLLHYTFRDTDYYNRDYYIVIEEIAMVETAKVWL